MEAAVEEVKALLAKTAEMENRRNELSGKIEECRIAEREISLSRGGMRIYKKAADVLLPQEKGEAAEIIQKRIEYLKREGASLGLRLEEAKQHLDEKGKALALRQQAASEKKEA